MFGHIPTVNRQVITIATLQNGIDPWIASLSTREPKSLRGLERLTLGEIDSGTRKELLGKLTSIHAAVASPLFDLIAVLHDFGKFNPPPDNYFNHPHPVTGYRKLQAFLGAGNSIINYAAMPEKLRRIFTESDINNMILAIQLAHNALPGPALGENSRAGTFYGVLTEPCMQAILQDPAKRSFYFNALALLAVCDVAALGFLSAEKINYYIGTAAQLDALCGSSSFDFSEVRPFSNIDLREFVATLYPAETSDPWREDFWTRFEAVTSANTAPNDMRYRSEGKLREKFTTFVQTNYGAKAEEVLSALTDLFGYGIKMEYFRNFWIAVTNGNNDRSGFQKEVLAFSKPGIDFILAMAKDVEAKRQALITQGKLDPQAGVIVTTGHQNSQNDFSIMTGFHDQVARSPERWDRFFKEFSSVEPTSSADIGTFRITYRPEDYLEAINK
jgi:hypothetical protein